jgi:hypothetical protein
VKPLAEQEVNARSELYFEELMASLEKLPSSYSSKDLGK